MATATGNSGKKKVTKLIQVWKNTNLPVLDANGNRIIQDNIPSHPGYIPDVIDLCDCPVDDVGTGCVPTTPPPPTTTTVMTTIIGTTQPTVDVCQLALIWNPYVIVCNPNGTSTITVSVSGNQGFPVQFFDPNFSQFVDGVTLNSYSFTVISNAQSLIVKARMKGCVNEVGATLQACSGSGVPPTTNIPVTSIPPVTTTSGAVTTPPVTTVPPVTTTGSGVTTTSGITTASPITTTLGPNPCTQILTWNSSIKTCLVGNMTEFTVSVAGNGGYQVQFWDPNTNMFVDGNTLNSYTFQVPSNNQVFTTHARVKGCTTEIEGFLQACAAGSGGGTTTAPPITTTPGVTTAPPVTTTSGGGGGTTPPVPTTPPLPTTTSITTTANITTVPPQQAWSLTLCGGGGNATRQVQDMNLNVGVIIKDNDTGICYQVAVLGTLIDATPITNYQEFNSCTDCDQSNVVTTTSGGGGGTTTAPITTVVTTTAPTPQAWNLNFCGGGNAGRQVQDMNLNPGVVIQDNTTNICYEVVVLGALFDPNLITNYQEHVDCAACQAAVATTAVTTTVPVTTTAPVTTTSPIQVFALRLQCDLNISAYIAYDGVTNLTGTAINDTFSGTYYNVDELVPLFAGAEITVYSTTPRLPPC